MTKIEQAKETLREAGYFVDNLWRIDDVTWNYECTDEQAHEILFAALTHPYIVENVFSIINDKAEELELKEKED